MGKCSSSRHYLFIITSTALKCLVTNPDYLDSLQQLICHLIICCSEVLGSSIDIHTGGVDLKFPHHDNELAQSEVQ